MKNLMRSTLAAFAVAMMGTGSGCTSFSDVTQAKPYSCSWRDAGAAECPSGWRCGYDNRCFNPDGPTGLKACKFDDDCFTRFRCSFDNQCFDPALETPRSCTVDRQCADGWRCGANQSCFNPSEPVARACATTTDCADGWRCGVSGYCQDRAVGADYVCRVDDDCELDWRCDLLAERCVLVRDALAGASQSVVAEVLHPLRTLGVPSHVAVSGIDETRTNLGDTRLAVAIVDGGAQLVLTGRDRVLAFTWSPLPVTESDVVDLVALRERAVFRTRNLDTFVVGLDGGISFVVNGATRLRQVDPVSPSSRFFDAGTPRLAVLVNGSVALLSASLTGLPFTPADAGLGRRVPQIFDVAAVDDMVATLTDEGVMFNDRPVALSCSHRLFPASTLLPLADGGAPHCASEEPMVRSGAGVSFSLLHAVLNGSNAVAVVSTSDDGGTLVGIAERRSQSLDVRADPMIVCPRGLTPLQLSLAYGGDSTRGEIVAVARCPSTVLDGSVVPEATWVVAASGRAEPRFSRIELDDGPWKQGFRPQRTSSNTRAHGGRNGLFWFAGLDSMGAELPYPMPMFLDRRPAGVVRIGRGGVSALMALSTEFLFAWQPGAGFATQGEALRGSSQGQYVPIGGVAGRSTWQVTPTGVMDVASFPLGGDAPRFVATLATGVAALVTPGSAQVQDLPDGTRLLVVVSGDRLLTADVTVSESNEFSVPAPLEVRLVPSSGVPLRGLSIDPSPRAAADGGVQAVATGFILTDNSTYAFAASSPSRWALTTVPVPVRFGAPIDLWNENGHARLAFERGTILTLPERVPLANDVPGTDAGIVGDFARLCGTTYAVRSDGVYRALPGVDGGLASWASVPSVPVPREEFSSARFFEAEAAVFVATDTGRVVELRLGRSDAGTPVCP